MAWELVAIWLIVGVTLVAFVQSERRREMATLKARARHYALSPAYRHQTSEAPMPQAYTPTGLSQSDRLFLQTLANRKRPSQQ
jgi:hypothetical protein